MPTDPRYDILFEPVRIGPKTLRNRFYQTPHCSGFGAEKPWSQAHHRATKAEGGWAAVCTESAPIGPDADMMPYFSARLWDEGDVQALARTADAVHAHGALAGIELHHSGALCELRESRCAPVAPSPLAALVTDSNYHQVRVPKALERSDIRRLQAEWAAAAKRARSAGFDIVYVAGSGYLPEQFLSPFSNTRTDEYGGSLENRARFWVETLERVRAAVGEQCAIAVRASVSVQAPDGIDLDELLGFVRLADHLVDLWDVKIADWSRDSAASRFCREGYELEWTGRIREATAKPIVGVGRLTSPDRMVEIIRSGVWDLIGAARPSISDPFLPRKIEEGRLDEIRECIGCNQCTSRASWGHHIGCTQNATAGEEYRRGWHPERFDRARNADRDVLVVGAGPAGMECAIVLAKRGLRRVHLVEAEAEIGGLMRWVPRLPGLGEWARVVDYRAIQLEKQRNVEVIAGRRLDAEAVRQYGGEIVVLATGARWAADGLNAITHRPIPGADASRPHVLTSEQVMVDGKRPPGRRVVVYDGDGYFVGPGVAEQLASEGFVVQLVTCLDQIAPFCTETLEGELLRQRLHRLGVDLRRRVTVTSVAPGGSIGYDEFGQAVELEADAIVLVTQRVPDDTLYLELAAGERALEAQGVEALFRVGDCVAPRILADAIFEGHRVAREIDSPDPGVPLPYRRELPAYAPSISRTAATNRSASATSRSASPGSNWAAL